MEELDERKRDLVERGKTCNERDGRKRGKRELEMQNGLEKTVKETKRWKRGRKDRSLGERTRDGGKRWKTGQVTRKN